MSIISKSREAKANAMREYHNTCAANAIAERDEMNKMLNLCREAGWDGVTAAQIEALTNGKISIREAAGNLTAMMNHRSRYGNCCPYVFGVRVPEVDIPTYNGEEQLRIVGGGKRKANIVEIDDNGIVIAGTQRTISVYDSARYGIVQRNSKRPSKRK